MREWELPVKELDARNRDLILLGLCVALFVLSWLKFFLPPLWLYLADYVSRAAIILLIVFVIGRGPFIGLMRDPAWAALSILGVASMTLVWDQALIRSGVYFPPIVDWHYPLIQDPVLRWGDAVFGIALVAISEEAVFRSLPARIGEKKDWNVWVIYGVSTLLFAAIHLPQGVTKFLFAAGFGLMAMWLYRRFGSLWVPIAAHYLVDLVLFSEIGCWMNVRACS